MSTIAIIILAAIILLAVGVLLWAVLQDAFINIKPGELGLVINRGKPADKGLPPGVHFALRFGRVIEIYPAVELTYLTVPEEQAATTPGDTLTLIDPPLRVTLGDRTAATVNYTVRFRLDPEKMPIIHTRFGTTGLKSILRDESRRVLIDAMSDPAIGIDDVLGSRRNATEARIRERLEAALAECGFAMAMFNLREVDLDATGEVIQSTLRAAEELERERAMGAVRALRAEQEAAINAVVTSNLSAPMLEYLRVQATRELIDRWDGKLMVPPGPVGLVPEAPAAPAPAQEAPTTESPPAEA